MHILTIAVAAAVVGGSCSATAHELQTTTPAIASDLPAEATDAERVVDAFHAALGRGDAAAALALLADDALIFEQGGAERSKAEYASHHLAADVAFAQAVPDTRLRRTGRVEGDLAWIASEGRTTGDFRGRAVDRVTTETMVLRRQGGGWAIVHIHWSSAAAPKG